MTLIFDGNKYSLEKEEKLKKRVEKLRQKGVKPKLVSIIVGDDPASHLYVNLKKKAGERIGVTVEVRSEKSDVGKDELIRAIGELNSDDSVNGIMIQLPLPSSLSETDKTEIINSISPEKDVDGLRRSRFLHPTSKAVLEILDLALKQTKHQPKNVCVVGATGMVGKPLVRKLRNKKFKLWEIDSATADIGEITKICDVVISATGVQDLIKASVVKTNVILIDVGSPKGDIEKNAYKKASFVSPVPGGVGPVTISCLLENLLNSIK